MRRLTENFNSHTTRTSRVSASMAIVLVLRSSNTPVVDGQAGFGSIHKISTNARFIEYMFVLQV